jgi:hypothetical protein
MSSNKTIEQIAYEQYDNIDKEIKRFLSEPYPKDATLTRPVHNVIFGKNDDPNGKMNLSDQKKVVSMVKNTMFYAKEYLFQVIVTSKKTGTSIYVPKRVNTDSFDFKIPAGSLTSIYLKPLCDFSPPAMYLYYHEHGGKEEIYHVSGTASNEIFLKTGEMLYIAGTEISNKDENDSVILKTDDGVPILRMNFHLETWTREPYADETASFHHIVQKFKEDVHQARNNDDLMEHIFHLEENFNWVILELLKAQELESNSQHPNKRSFDHVASLYALLARLRA